MSKKKGKSPEDELKLLTERVKKRRFARSEREKRQIQCGIINGKVYENGSYIIYVPKGIQHWYDTRTLVNKVTEIMDRNEKICGEHVCHINGNGSYRYAETPEATSQSNAFCRASRTKISRV